MGQLSAALKMDDDMQMRRKMDLFREALQNYSDDARVMIERDICVGLVYENLTSLQFSLLSPRPLVSTVKTLLDYGAWLKPSLDYALKAFEATGDCYDVFKLLLERGDLCTEITIPVGITPLLYALKYASLNYVQLLLDHGANIRAVDDGGRTALHYAAQNRRMDVLQLVLDHGFDIECSDNGGWTALHIAVLDKNRDACELLLEKGADVNRKENEGITPLMWAVYQYWDDHRGLVSLLLERGANVNDKYRRTISVLKLAKGGATELLIQQMAKMVHLNQSLDECNRRTIEDHFCYREFYIISMKELQDMKEAKFYNNVSVFDIFMARDKIVAGYVRNDELVEALEKRNYNECFPIYFAHFKKKFDLKVQKHKLRKAAANILSNLLGFNDPLHVVNPKILSYIKDEDLSYLTNVSLF